MIITSNEAKLITEGKLKYNDEVTGLSIITIAGPLPILNINESAVLKENRDGWTIVEDYRGLDVLDSNDSPVYISEVGPLPEGCRVLTDNDPYIIKQKYDVALEDALDKLLIKRKSVEYGGFMLNNQRWDSEEKDELRLNSLSAMMEKLGVTEFPGWKINHDTFITLTPTIALQAGVAMMQHYNQCFIVEETKKYELRQLTTAEQVEEWLQTRLDIGWPTE